MEKPKSVLTIGTFDTPHLGHAILFKRSEQLGELSVGINSDDFVERYKGKRPIFSYEERARLIGKLGYRTYRNDSAGHELIEAVRPDFLVIGSDWATKDYYSQIDVTQSFLDNRGISVVYMPYTEDISSTEIKRRLSESNNNSNH